MKKWIAILFLIFNGSLFAQVKQSCNLNICKAQTQVKIDGVLDEEVWSTAQKADDFVQQFPFDSSLALSKTEVMVTYDESFLYIGAICHDEVEGDFIVQSLKRDFAYPNNDKWHR